ncbi:hypothetical protein RJT34_10737 [Clitoria ternatea]|uniref:C2 domain-containing protein n=1 Tax=Clitoria ternatea TaxID=43366 RepID=A0AAN9JLE3_CLITE
MSQIQPPFQLLELNVISAQDLAPIGRNMRTYAVTWVHPDRKLSTKVDTEGHSNPTWNDKFVFRVDDAFLYSDASAIMVEIYALHWFKDIHVGTVRVLVGNLIPPPEKPQSNRPPLGMRFVALQVRRPSGRPQGILNIGITVLDGSMRSMPLYALNASAVGYRHLMGEKDAYDSHNHLSPHVLAADPPKPEFRRSKSDTSSMVAGEAVARHQHHANVGKANFAISGSEVNVQRKSKHNVKKKNKKVKKKNLHEDDNSSILSSAYAPSSVLSDTVLPWKVKSGKTPSPHHNDHVQPLMSPPPHYDAVEAENHTVDSVSEIAINEANPNTIHTNQEFVPVKNFAYEVTASPKPQFRNSPTPAPAHFRNTPARNSPAPQFKNSPTMPQFRNSPMPPYANSPMPHHASSPKPHYASSPKPHYASSPKPHYASSPKPQYMNSPAPQFRNSPTMSHFRNSPTVSKFNPAVAFNGSQRPTPMHPLGRMNGAGYEYATPMRSNLGRPLVMTNSELGPSPSEVAAEMAKYPVIDEGDNYTVGGWNLDESVEGLQTKLERWQTVLQPVSDRGEFSNGSYPTPATKSTKSSRHSRRHTDGGAGLFSCFSKICGVEFSIVCGGDKAQNTRRRGTPSNLSGSSM